MVYDMNKYRKAMRLMWSRMRLRYIGVLKHPTAPYYVVPYPNLDDFERREKREKKEDEL